jgi:hypothetical protein
MMAAQRSTGSQVRWKDFIMISIDWNNYHFRINYEGLIM